MAVKDPKTVPAFTQLSVIERRLKNPFGVPSREIPLNGDKRGWVVRTFASDPEHPNRHYDAVHRLGWVPLGVDDLCDSPQSLGYVVSPDGRIVRGDKGQEVLMAMPREQFDQIQREKAKANLRSLQGSSLRSDVAQATAKTHGDEAGDHTYKHFTHRDVIESA